MKVINYQIATELNHGTEKQLNKQLIFNACSMPYTEKNLKLAKEEAYNGEITITDDPSLVEPKPSAIDRIFSMELALTSLMLGGTVDTEFLRLQYRLGNLTQESIQSAVPLRLTEEQANSITGGTET